MDAIYNQFLQVLNELVVLYRNLFDHLGHEKNYLISADIENLKESTKTKEALLFQIRSTDKQREIFARDVGVLLNMKVLNPRLLALAEALKINHRDKSNQLINLHKTLTLQIERVIELNQENEKYTKSALRTLNGAINDIKDAAVGPNKKVYGKQGQKTQSQETQSGNFVSKEA